VQERLILSDIGYLVHEGTQRGTLCQSEKSYSIATKRFAAKFSVVVLDIDECVNGANNCDVNAVCNNTGGSYNCSCKDGFHGDGIHCTGNYLFGLISSALGKRLV